MPLTCALCVSKVFHLFALRVTDCLVEQKCHLILSFTEVFTEKGRLHAHTENVSLVEMMSLLKTNRHLI